MKDFLVPLLVPLILGILLRLASAEKPIQLENNAILLQYGKSMRTFGIGFPLILLGFFIYVIMNKPPKDQEHLKAAIALFCMPFPFLLYFYLEFFKVKIIVEDKKIIATTPWRGTREYLWSEINEITYSPSFRWLRIKAKDKKMLYISTLISGINEFWKRATKQLPLATYEKALKELN
jgi:hypothetical protein